MGPALPTGTNPTYHASIQVTASDGRAHVIHVTTRLRPDRFSLRLPSGVYRMHDLAPGWRLPNNRVTVRAGATSHVDLGSMACY